MKQYPDFPYVRDEMLTKIIGCAINGEAIRSDLIENMVAEIRELRAGADRAAQLEAEVARLRVNDARYRALVAHAVKVEGIDGRCYGYEFLPQYRATSGMRAALTRRADALLGAGQDAAAQPQEEE